MSASETCAAVHRQRSPCARRCLLPTPSGRSDALQFTTRIVPRSIVRTRLGWVFVCIFCWYLFREVSSGHKEKTQSGECGKKTYWISIYDAVERHATRTFEASVIDRTCLFFSRFCFFFFFIVFSDHPFRFDLYPLPFADDHRTRRREPPP